MQKLLLQATCVCSEIISMHKFWRNTKQYVLYGHSRCLILKLICACRCTFACVLPLLQQRAQWQQVWNQCALLHAQKLLQAILLHINAYVMPEVVRDCESIILPVDFVFNVATSLRYHNYNYNILSSLSPKQNKSALFCSVCIIFLHIPNSFRQLIGIPVFCFAWTYAAPCYCRI
jgi:hypothetical protein